MAEDSRNMYKTVLHNNISAWLLPHMQLVDNKYNPISWVVLPSYTCACVHVKLFTFESEVTTVMLITLHTQKHTNDIHFKHEVNAGNRAADKAGVFSDVMHTQVFQFKWPLITMDSHIISILLPKNVWFWVSCEHDHTVRLSILMIMSIEITVFWDITPVVCQIKMNVSKKPATFSLRAHALNMEANGLSEITVFHYQNAQYHTSDSLRWIMYSPSAGQLRCAVLPAGFITAWVMMFGFVKWGAMWGTVSLFVPAGWLFSLPEESSSSWTSDMAVIFATSKKCILPESVSKTVLSTRIQYF